MLALCLALLQPPPIVIEREISEEIRAEELAAHVYRLASPEFEGRRGAGAARAGRYIEERFRDMKLQPLFGDSYFQTIPSRTADEKPDAIGLGRNVGAWLPGTDPALKDEWIILSAHFDHLGMRNGKLHPGADDNASGVAMLIEVAEKFALQAKKPRRSIAFVAFDLEEVGLLGSAHFAARPPREFAKLKAFITADMVGRTMANVMDEYAFALGSESSAGLRKLLEETTPPDGLKAGRIGADVIGSRSDYAAFRDRHVPFLFLCTGMHDDYHQPTDTPDKLDYAKLRRVTRWAASLMQKLADADEAPKWADKSPPDFEEVRTIHTLVVRILQRTDKFPLSETQRKIAGNVRDKLAGMLERGKVTPEERSALVLAAKLLLSTMSGF